MENFNFLKTSIASRATPIPITVDCAIFGFQNNELTVLLVKRLIEPFKGYWLLPGGAMDEDETAEEAVNRILFELIGVKDIPKEQVKFYSKIDRHPARRVVTVGFYALVKPENHQFMPKQFISDIQWVSVKKLPEAIGFDHRLLLKDALEKLEQNLKEKLIFGELLPDLFTMRELQDLYEAILGTSLDRRNFRKKIMQMGLIENTKKKKQGVQGGPELYRMVRPRQ